jgi:hypothetical protein
MGDYTRPTPAEVAAERLRLPSRGRPVRNHDGRKVYQCSYRGCYRLFFSCRGLQFHQHSHNPGPKITCVMCGKHLSTRQVAQAHAQRCPRLPHARRKGTPLAPGSATGLQCGTCRQMFHFPARLAVHCALTGHARTAVAAPTDEDLQATAMLLPPRGLRPRAKRWLSTDSPSSGSSHADPSGCDLDEDLAWGPDDDAWVKELELQLADM